MNRGISVILGYFKKNLFDHIISDCWKFYGCHEDEGNWPLTTLYSTTDDSEIGAHTNNRKYVASLKKNVWSNHKPLKRHLYMV